MDSSATDLIAIGLHFENIMTEYIESASPSAPHATLGTATIPNMDVASRSWN